MIEKQERDGGPDHSKTFSDEPDACFTKCRYHAAHCLWYTGPVPVPCLWEEGVDYIRMGAGITCIRTKLYNDGKNLPALIIMIMP